MLVNFGLCAALAVAAAKPLVVDLESDWYPRPFALEVLETITAKNSSAFYPLISLYLSHEQENGAFQSDEAVSDYLFEKSLTFLSESSVKLAKAEVAAGLKTAFIQAHYQNFEQNFIAGIGQEFANCDNVLFYGGKATCDATEVFTLETNVNSDGVRDLGSHDHVIGGGDNTPVAVLYGDILSEDFPQFHANLLASALEQKISYILRYKPSKKLNGSASKLSGYGATVQVKRTDYLVVDDRPVKDSAKNTELKLDIDAPNKVEKRDIPQIPLKVASYILGAKDKFATLFDVVQNIPSYLSTITGTKINQDMLRELEDNKNSGYFAPGTNILLANGVAVTKDNDYNAFEFLRTLSEETELVDSLVSIGLPTDLARDLLTSGAVVYDENGREDRENLPLKRFDYRSPAISWLNDIEHNAQYNKWSRKLDVLTEPRDPKSPLVQIRRNMNNLVLALDLTSPAALQTIGQLFQILMRGAPIRIGIVPLDKSDGSEYFLKAGTEGSYAARQAYVYGLVQGKSPQEAYNAALEASQTAGAKVDVKNILTVEDTKSEIVSWVNRLAIDHHSVIANGVFIPVGQDWLYDTMQQFLNDQDAFTILVEEGSLEKKVSVENIILAEAVKERNELLDPVDDSQVHFVNTHSLYKEAGTLFASWAPGVEDPDFTPRTLWVVADFSTEQGLDQLIEALAFVSNKDSRSVRLNVLPLLNVAKSNDDEYVHLLNAILEMANRPAAVSKIAIESLKTYYLHNGPKPTFWDKVNPIGSKELLSAILPRAASSIFTLETVSPCNLIIDGRLVSVVDVVPKAHIELLLEREQPRVSRLASALDDLKLNGFGLDAAITLLTSVWHDHQSPRIVSKAWKSEDSAIEYSPSTADHKIDIVAILDPASERGQEIVSLLQLAKDLDLATIKVFLAPKDIAKDGAVPNRYYQGVFSAEPKFDAAGQVADQKAVFNKLGEDVLYVVGINEPSPWVVMTKSSDYDLDNVILNTVTEEKLYATYELRALLLEGYAQDVSSRLPPRGIQLSLGSIGQPNIADTMVMANLGYYQFQASPGHWQINLEKGPSTDIFDFIDGNFRGSALTTWITDITGKTLKTRFTRKQGKENADVLEELQKIDKAENSLFGKLGSKIGLGRSKPAKTSADVNIFTVASGHLYERFLSIMTLSVMRHSKHTVKFWLIENFLSPSFKEFLPTLAENYGFEYELVTYKWPKWLRSQSEKQREIWGYKILFLDVLFPQTLSNVIFVDSDQIVRTDLKELVDIDLHGAPYGYTPMGDDREETEGFRFWKQGYWQKFLDGKPYHISALYTVDLDRFREIGAGDRLRQHYQQLSADPNSLSNLDQDLPNNLQHIVPIYSLDKDWLWCETWCADEGLETAKTIDLCNNPLTKEPKLDRARRQIPEWVEYDDEIAALRESFFTNKSKHAEDDNIVVEQAEDGPIEEDEPEHYEL